MERELLIKKTEEFVKTLLTGDSSGHDWWHIKRVRDLALRIADSEGVDLFLVNISALLHDVDDWKLVENVAIQNRAQQWLQNCNVDESLIYKILQIIEGVSFKGAGVNTSSAIPECKVLQDADRLDAIGAIGIARAFAYGGSKGRPIFDPAVKPEMHLNFDSYKKSKGNTINHFHEKLLLLKDLMQTETGRAMAVQRHDYMLLFLTQFNNEWNGLDFCL